MEKTLLELAAANGLWAALFVFLFIYVLYDSRKREKRYQDTIHENQEIIKSLSNRLETVDSIKKDVGDIKDELKRR